MEWNPAMDAAPKDGTKFWGRVGDDAISMFWHPQFEAFISSFRRMTMARGYTFGDGATHKDHSPVVHNPTAWMPLPSPPEASPAEPE